MSDRYPMTTDQPAQIDCRHTDCHWNAGGGRCTNVSPAVTLHAGGKAMCWSSYKREEDDVSDKVTFEAKLTDFRRTLKDGLGQRPAFDFTEIVLVTEEMLLTPFEAEDGVLHVGQVCTVTLQTEEDDVSENKTVTFEFTKEHGHNVVFPAGGLSVGRYRAVCRIERVPQEPTLKPCPFCGYPASGVSSSSGVAPRIASYWVRCRECRASTGEFNTRRAAVAAWNRRDA